MSSPDRSEMDSAFEYRGYREGVDASERVLVMLVDVGGKRRPLLDRCRRDRGDHCHSPAGFNWGYGGSGPSELARQILWDYLGASPHPALYQDFKRDVVARFPQEQGWKLPARQILDWLRAREDDTTWLAPPPIAGPAAAHVERWQRELAIRARLGFGAGKAGDELVIAEQWAAEDAQLGPEEDDDA
jgi:hypothetical protein